MLAGKWKDFQWLPSIFESGGYWFFLPAMFVHLLSLCQNDTWQDNSLFMIRIHSEWSFSGDKTPAPGISWESHCLLSLVPQENLLVTGVTNSVVPAPGVTRKLQTILTALYSRWLCEKKPRGQRTWNNGIKHPIWKYWVQGGLKGQGCQIGSKEKNWEGIEIIQETSNKRWR